MNKESNKEKKYKGKHKGLTNRLIRFIEKLKRDYEARKYRSGIKRLEAVHRKIRDEGGW